ncbi:hypothetical protein [Listeria booriae]|uniref:Uncharacterized protein n=1 Tax=Listeria booriae TaxID=1552123 RepID=A0A7X1CXV8_9LIST|nr:hypothetical protein [Listeria booriae]MBC1290594.1 hypothetical protein [Listeria booriae]MBC2115718.1 hypothetical protein [Listeria booriae]
MPNWLVGDFKIRGTKEKLTNFLKNEIISVAYYPLEKAPDIKVTIDKEFEDIKIESTNVLRLKFGRRNHLNVNALTFDFYGESDECEIVVLEDVEFAWGILPDGHQGGGIHQYVEKSKEYGVDFRFYGFEMGGEFNQEFEIINGELKFFRDIEFKDYKWECVKPNMGG